MLISWRLVHLPPHLTDYVVAHELAHLRELNHSPRFWAIVANLFPEYLSARRELNRLGPRCPRYRRTSMRILHTMLRVGDLERSLKFYSEVLGMKVLRRTDYPEGKFTLAFVGYGAESEGAVIELTHNWGVEKYDLGNAFGHIAIAVEDAYKACWKSRNAAERSLSPGPMKHGTTVIAFVEDPDGYKIEFVQRGTPR